MCVCGVCLLLGFFLGFCCVFFPEDNVRVTAINSVRDHGTA